MSDYRQDIYDAVRSKLSNGDIGSAVESVLRDANIAFFFDRASYGIVDCFIGYNRPSAIFKPKLAKDGNAWIACLGDNLQEGVVGVGETPEKAMADFDANWVKS